MAASSFHFVVSFIVAIAFSSIHASQAGRHLLQAYQPGLPIPPLPKATLPPLPAMPNLPVASLPPMPSNPLPSLPKPTLPPMPTIPKAALPPMPAIPSIPTAVPSFPFLSPPPSN